MIYNYGQNLGIVIFICISSIEFICLIILVWVIFRLPSRPRDFRLKHILFYVKFDVTAVLSKWNDKLILSSTWLVTYM